jgi:hypothetical protein
VTAHRSGSGISVELDELSPGWAEKRGYFVHADLPLNVGGEEVGWRSLSPRVHNTRMCPTVATICASGPGRSARASPPSERRDRRPGRRRRTAPERLRPEAWVAACFSPSVSATTRRADESRRRRATD